MMSIKTWLVTGASCAVLALSACGDGGSDSGSSAASGSDGGQASGKVLRVAMNAEFAPFESQDENKNLHGFDVDLINAMASAGGFKVKLQHQPWDSLFPALGNGDVDVLASAITITDERKNTMDFSDPYYQIKQVVLVPSNKNISSIEDVKKLPKVGVVTGQTGDFAAQKLFGATSSNIARFENVNLMIKEVENGGLSAAISDSAVIAHYIKNNHDKGFEMVDVPDFETENYGFAVRKGDAEKLGMLNDALKKIRDNGQYAEIESKYFSNGQKTEAPTEASTEKASE